MNRVPFSEIDGSPYVEWWNDRFAPQIDIFDGMRFYRRGKANIWVGTADVAKLSSTRLDAVGVHLLRVGRRLWKPTSGAIVTFGSASGANAVDLDRAEVSRFLAGADVEFPGHDPRNAGLSRGFLAARFAGVAIGCGEWHDGGVIHSLIPRNARINDIDM